MTRDPDIKTEIKKITESVPEVVVLDYFIYFFKVKHHLLYINMYNNYNK